MSPATDKPPATPRYGTAGAQPEESEESIGQKRPSALSLGPRKRPNLHTDPLIHHGRHFGRSVYAFANVHALLLAGSNEPHTSRERRELRIFRQLLQLVPNLEDRLMECSEEELMSVANMIQKGASGARSDDTKTLKGAIIDWLVEPGGPPLSPQLSRNVKINRGFNHDRTGFLLCPPDLKWNDENIRQQLRDKQIVVTGSHWPIFVYQNEKFDPDQPWKGLFRGRLLVQGFKHIFTCPSSVDEDPRATRSGNARIHGMTQVTRASIAYVATQVRFALTAASTFSHSDRETDSETFYTSVLEVLEDPEEQDEVKELMGWWNQ
ncbi:hypothetical protein FA13DRAFT_1758706 [Coprinellus micaceus]|uniref:Uncharacterized protein n=1 Tax=Coprinellus micaceus TaxID=71717 RepID=A0A4Y7SAZ8_COPMI|nr:hypothetical protein FA13DRAFT_1758706 [Coprinellus micaceus]